MSEEQAHSIYGPSGSKRWMTCPASIQMEAQIERGPSEYNFPAEEGTAAHELAEKILCLEQKASDFIGEVFNKDFVVDQEMANQVQKYVDYVEGAQNWDSTLLVEERVHMPHIEETMFGTADVIIYDEETVEVIDLKYGRGIVVEVEDNPQLMLYACGVLKKLADEGIRYNNHTQIKLTIVQPRAPHKDGPVRSAFITVAQLRDFQRLVIRAVELSKEEVPPFGASDDGCRWCAAAPVCKEYAKFNLLQMQLEFEDFAAPKLGERLIDARSMSDKQIADILKHTKGITQWLKTLADYAVSELTRGNEVPGFKLVYGRSNRRWSDSTQAESILTEEGVDRSRMYTEKFKTAPQMEKELRPEEWDMVAGLVEKPQGKITLAPNSDGRPSINPNVEAVSDWSEE